MDSLSNTEQQLMGNAVIQIVAKTCWLRLSRARDRLHTNTLNISFSIPILSSLCPMRQSLAPSLSYCGLHTGLREFVGQFVNISLVRFGNTDCVLRLCIIYQLMCFPRFTGSLTNANRLAELSSGCSNVSHSGCNLLSAKENENGIESFQCLSTIKCMQHTSGFDIYCLKLTAHALCELIWLE